MKKTTFVALLVLISSPILAKNITPEVNNIESQWANIHYGKNNVDQRKQYPTLIKKTQKLSKKHPNSVEFFIWEAIIISTNAAYESPFSALESLNKAKQLLEKAILNNPTALDGAAQVALGTLYYMVPGWPISFGDSNMAEQLLKKALEINPHGIDPNYFYADYLLSKDKITEAEKHFKLAINAPSRIDQLYADDQLKNEALISLQKTEDRKLDTEKNKFFSLFNSANSN